jgi:pimeloyl-ACP methyl ester carboxylesterase
MPQQSAGPTSHLFVSQRLRMHYVDWGNHGAPPIVLVHGGRDHARSWDWVAEDLRRDHHVIAVDLRGHGDSAWAIGSLYHVVEMVIDLAQLIDAIGAQQVVLLSHSLGSAVCAQYAGARPERVSKFVAIEGIDIPKRFRAMIDSLSARETLSRAIESIQTQAARSPRRYSSIDAAAKRMREVNSFLSEAQAHHLTEHGVARNEDGTYSWKFDDYARGPKLFRSGDDEIAEILAHVDCPVLLIRGTESDTPDPETSGLLSRFKNARAVAVEGAGHWVHHDRLDETLRLVRGFLKE